MRSENRIAGVSTLLVATIVLWGSRNLPLYDKRVPGPGLFPVVLALLMVALAIPLLVGRVTDAVSQSQEWSPDHRRVAGTLAATALLTLLIPILGFVVTTAIFLSALTLWWGNYRWWAVVLGSGLLSIVMLAVFQFWLGLVLPGGIVGS